jgi:hypothetical protein
MARATSTEPQAPRSSRSTPTRSAVDLPRSQTASKGGCWTCRLRRKKCDEQRQDDSCQTCIRLKIKCLGWGSKRPEWMRDKQAVEAYKADIKSQLTRAGLIRGQPRSSLMPTVAAPPQPPPAPPPPPAPVVPTTRQQSHQQYHALPAAAGPGPSLTNLDYNTYRYLDGGHRTQPNGHPPNNVQSSIVPEMTKELFAGASNGGFHRAAQGASFNDASLNLDTLNGTLFPYIHPGSLSTGSSTTSINTDGLTFDFNESVAQASNQDTALNVSQFQYEARPSSPTQGLALLAGQGSVQGDHVLYYFEHVRRLQYIFAGNSITNVTYSMIVQEPRGAVTNAVCALASLHYKRMRVAQGVEAPDTNPENSVSRYFYNEAYFQLINAKQVRHYTESDAVAALHLVSYSMFSGGLTDWRTVLTVALDWLGQTGLAGDENPRLAMLNMSFASRCAVKAVMWYDIFSSLTLVRPPKFIALYRRLLAGGGNGGGNYWREPDLNESNLDLHMESLSGCPDEVMLAIAEVSALAHWKETESCNGSLSVRELVRRGEAIERQLRQRAVDPVSFAEVDQGPLHPSLPQMLPPLNESGQAVLPFPDEEMRRISASLFREAAMLYLYTVLNDNYPGVPEISESVGANIQLFNQLPPSEVDRSLVFPICLAGCMTNDPVRRDVLKARLQAQDHSFGNLLLTRAVMEAVWQKRDAHGGVVDWRETMRDHSLNLLLV